MMFRELFASTTVYIGFDNNNDDEPQKINTSILRTCRQLSIEAAPIIAPNITLNIWNTKALIDFLFTLSPEIIKSIRYIDLCSGEPIPLYANDRMSYTTYHVDQAFCMFPGLALNVLTVKDCYHMPDCYSHGASDMSHIGTYAAIDGLIRIGGWKELHYITPTTQFMSDPCECGSRRRVPQPSNWNKLLLDRDGEQSGASVEMFVAKDPDIEGDAAYVDTSFEYHANPGQTLDLQADKPQTPKERWRFLESREVLVIAKRGVSTAYAQDGGELHGNIKDLLGRMSWEQVVADGIFIDPEDDPARRL
jgi:hypothetical protein